MSRVAVVTLVVLMAGCSNTIQNAVDPPPDASYTHLAQGETWNHDGRFRVAAAGDIVITATASDGRTVTRAGTNDVTANIPDGTWDIRFSVGGREAGHLKEVRIDGTPPDLSPLPVAVDTDKDGKATIAASGLEAGLVLDVRDSAGTSVATSLPTTVKPPAGIRPFTITATDPAGNVARALVHVRSGAQAQAVPNGTADFGIVARYTTRLQVWDISDPEKYLDRATARSQQPGYLGDGQAIDPGDMRVIEVVGQVVRDDMNTVEAAQALYLWMYDNLEYDSSRLSQDSLLSPAEVIGDVEDASGTDLDGDGIVDPGSGNGVRGGICRDLAATYVSLLRAAGVPARLVTGYLGGGVNGFHAWVEFYAGSYKGQPAWLPVDVASVDGPRAGQDLAMQRRTAVAQAFAIRPADSLPLRQVPPAGEVDGWSSSIEEEAQWPGNARAPAIQFVKTATPVFSDMGVLCVDSSSFARRVVSDAEQCAAFGLWVPNILVQAERMLDYGVDVTRASSGTTVNAKVAYPFPDAVAPDDVLFHPYGFPGTMDPATGKIKTTFKPA